VDDGPNLRRRGDQDVVLGLDEKQQREDKEPRGPEIDFALVRGLGPGVDRTNDCGRADATHR
jgi:hypothetical protein